MRARETEPIQPSPLVLLSIRMIYLEPGPPVSRVAQRSTVVARPDEDRLRHPPIHGADHGAINERSASLQVPGQRRLPNVDPRRHVLQQTLVIIRPPVHRGHPPEVQPLAGYPPRGPRWFPAALHNVPQTSSSIGRSGVIKTDEPNSITLPR